jgi:dihydrofolate synthase/folylpolyglutamate synthase
VTYDEAIAHLRSLQLHGFQPGLGTTRRLAALAGDPQERLRFIHVAGTNGKGSTCALLESVYRKAGLKVGLYTSPHLVRFGERIQVGRVPIAETDLARHVADLKALADTMTPTFFEFTTVLALRYLAEQHVDLVIWETGLGGRLDATNIVTPLASVVTNVAFDHQRILGDTIAAIASEKAGIIKPGVPVVTAAEDPDALAIIVHKAKELDAPVITLGEPEIARFKAEIPLLGRHQRANAALAAATVRLLRFVLPVDDTQLLEGLAEVNWPGRLQVVRRGAQTLVLDGAHNPAGIAALRTALAEAFPGKRPTLVLGMLADKDWRAMAADLVPLASRVVTAPVGSERTVTAEDLRAACVATGAGRPVKAAGSAAAALKLVAADPFVLVTGSLYFIGEVMEGLGLQAARGDERSLNGWSPPR